MSKKPESNAMLIERNYKSSTIARLEDYGYSSIDDINNCEIITEWLNRCFLDTTRNHYVQDDLFEFIKGFKEGVKIGQQVWMVKNLDVDTFRDGTPIQRVNNEEDWMNAFRENIPAWYYYDNNPTNGQLFGKLYNIHAVVDPRGLAPDGWKIPSDSDWRVLEDELGGRELAGGKMKARGFWKCGRELQGGVDNIGFLGLPGGACFLDYSDLKMGNGAAFWCYDGGWDRILSKKSNWVDYVTILSPIEGRSVRCLRENRMG